MKCTLQKTGLLHVLQKLQSLILSKPKVPILKMIAVSTTTDDGLMLSATDLVTSIMCFVPAIISKQGKTTIPGKQLLYLIRELSDVTVELETNQEDKTNIHTLNRNFELFGAPYSEYPKVAVPDNGVQIEVEAIELKTHLQRITFAASTESSRPALMGIMLRIDSKDNMLKLVCTDGRRLAQTSLIFYTQQTINDDLEIIMPIKAGDEVCKNLPNNMGQEPIKINITKEQLSFESSAFTLVTKLIDHTYPNVDQIIPQKKDCHISIELNTEELTRALKQVSLFSHEIPHPVKFEFIKDQLCVMSQMTTEGFGKVSIEIEPGIEAPFTIAFNPFFFLDVLRFGNNKNIRIWLSDPLNPCLISNDKNNTLYLLMPMRCS